MLWKEKYRVGVGLIDDQHEELFCRVEEFMKTLRSQEDWDQKITKVNETLEFMKEYVITHFHDEEVYQEIIGYPEIDEHRKIHSDMVAYVGGVAKQYEEEGFKEELMQQFGGKLLAWLINHVASSDQSIAEFAKSLEEANEQ